MLKLKTVGRSVKGSDGKGWFTVNVTESYCDSYLVRASDEMEAFDMVNDLINADEIDPSEDGEYERSVEPVGFSGTPDEGREYWDDVEREDGE